MALDQQVLSRFGASLHYAKETTFGTVTADSATLTKLRLRGNDIPNFEPNKFRDDQHQNRGLTMKDVGDHFATANGQLQRYSVPEFTPSGYDMKEFLYAALGFITTEDGTTPFLSTHTIDGTDDTDFGANEGYFFTLFGEGQITADSWKLPSCLIESLTLKWAGNDNGGRPVMSMNVVSGFKVATSTPSGTRVFNTTTAPSYHDSPRTLVVNTLDLYIRSIEIVIENDISFVAPDSGNFTGAKIQGRKIMINATVKYDSRSDGLMREKDNDVNGTAFTIGTSTAAPFFDITSDHTLVNSVEKSNGGEGESPSVTVALEPVLDSANSQNVQVRVSDGVDHLF
jgi:hypothetical protein